MTKREMLKGIIQDADSALYNCKDFERLMTVYINYGLLADTLRELGIMTYTEYEDAKANLKTIYNDCQKRMKEEERL